MYYNETENLLQFIEHNISKQTSDIKELIRAVCVIMMMKQMTMDTKSKIN